MYRSGTEVHGNPTSAAGFTFFFSNAERRRPFGYYLLQQSCILSPNEFARTIILLILIKFREMAIKRSFSVYLFIIISVITEQYSMNIPIYCEL